jgi:hypothetical protein
MPAVVSGEDEIGTGAMIRAAEEQLGVWNCY